MKRFVVFLTLYFCLLSAYTQTKDPDYIKSVQLRPLTENNFSYIVPLGTTLELSFDDLEADQKEYFYKIEMMTHDWKPTNLLANQYINGFQSNTIFNVQNAFNTFQNYTHYSVRFPNQNTTITKSGNYIISVLNDVDEVIFSRRLILYENIAPVGVSVTRSRNAQTVNQQQTVNFTVNHPTFQLNNPDQEIHVVVMQNQVWNTAIYNLRPQFYKPGQLVYNYTTKTNFWGGNEYLFFDNKIIRNASINVQRVERRYLMHNYLYPYKNQFVKNYTYNPDINGQFIVRTLEGSDPKTEADYAMMHFKLEVDEEFKNKEVFVYGAFNNFSFTKENKMVYDELSQTYKSNFLLKQGFYNYTYVTRDEYDFISQEDIRGNFSKTENEYTVIVYYKPMGALFDRVIGVGSITFQGER